jgi:hypothetical protein
LNVIEVERISWTDNKWYRFALGQTGMPGAKRVFEEPGIDRRTARGKCDQATFALIREFINTPTDNQERCYCRWGMPTAVLQGGCRTVEEGNAENRTG